MTARCLRRAGAMRHLVPTLLLCVGCGSSAAPATDASTTEWPPLPVCIDPFGMPSPHELVRGTGPGGVSYRLWRCYYMQGAGFTGVYRADAFELVFGGRVYRTETADIVYDSTHHNWYDSLVATHPDAILHWRVEWQSSDGSLWHYVSATDRSGTTTLLPETRAD